MRWNGTDAEFWWAVDVACGRVTADDADAIASAVILAEVLSLAQSTLEFAQDSPPSDQPVHADVGTVVSSERAVELFKLGWLLQPAESAIDGEWRIVSAPPSREDTG